MATVDRPSEGTLLIVEDEVDLLEILVEMLTPCCAKVITVANGKEALEILAKAEPVHAILSDINMPQMSGFQLLAHLRGAGNAVPFITLTAYGDQENMRESIRLNATDFLTKPFDRKELAEVVCRAVIQGVKLRQMESEILEYFKKAGVSEKTMTEVKSIQRQIMTLRIEHSRYIKNSQKKL